MNLGKVTFGYLESIAELEDPVTEPCTVADVKAYLGLDSNTHDTTISNLITAIRKQVEKAYSVSLTPKAVSVSWQTFYDYHPFPYAPVKYDTIVVKSNEVVVTNAVRKVTGGITGDASVYGDFPNGIELTYETVSGTDNNIKQRIIEAAAACLSEEVTINDALIKYFKYAGI